jgi:DNA processing protein
MTGLPDRLARVVLSRIGEPGDPRLCGLVRDLGAPAVLDGLLAQGPLDEAQRDLAQRLGSVDPYGELERAERLGVRFLVPGDAEWPAGLDDLASAEAHRAGAGLGGVPVGLWLRGPRRLDDLPPMVALVGSRSSTTYGERVAGDVAAATARAGMVVLSGAAAGIDQAAHRGALAAGGTTVAVLACGPERAYPTAHRALIDHIAATGLIVSEVPPGSAPLRSRFLGRNRLIAALSVGTVVVEAALRSGALSSARWAVGLNRVVMGVPGPVTSVTSQGVHEEIRKGSMHLVGSGADVLELVGAAGEHLVDVRRAPTRPRDRLSARDRRVLDAVPVGRPAGADSIAVAAGIALQHVQGALERLASGGWVRRAEQGWRLARDEPHDHGASADLRSVNE